MQATVAPAIKSPPKLCVSIRFKFHGQVKGCVQGEGIIWYPCGGGNVVFYTFGNFRGFGFRCRDYDSFRRRTFSSQRVVAIPKMIGASMALMANGVSSASRRTAGRELHYSFDHRKECPH